MLETSKQKLLLSFRNILSGRERGKKVMGGILILLKVSFILLLVFFLVGHRVELLGRQRRRERKMERLKEAEEEDCKISMAKKYSRTLIHNTANLVQLQSQKIIY